jgi:hypothetical protein
MRISVRSNDRRVREILKMKKDYRTTVPLSRSVHRVLPDGSWKGQRCFLVGGGPSLKGFDFKRLVGERVIAINRAFLDCPFADLLFFMDKNRFHRWVIEGRLGDRTRRAFRDFKGLKVFLYMNHDINDVWYVPRAGRKGIPVSLKDGIHHGTNSGYAALQIAICLEASPVYLLGYDMSHEVNEKGKEVANYHEAYPEQPPEKTTHSFMKGFIDLSVDLSVKGHPVRIINLNPNSGLRCFPFGDIEEVLNGRTNISES